MGDFRRRVLVLQRDLDAVLERAMPTLRPGSSPARSGLAPALPPQARWQGCGSA